MSVYTPGVTTSSAAADRTVLGVGTTHDEDIPTAFVTAIFVRNPTITITGLCTASAAGGGLGDNSNGTGKVQYSTDGGSGWTDVGSLTGVNDLYAHALNVGLGGSSDTETSHTVNVALTGIFRLSNIKIRTYCDAVIVNNSFGDAEAHATADVTDWYVTAAVAATAIMEA